MDSLDRLKQELDIEVKAPAWTDQVDGVSPAGVAVPADEETANKLVAWCGKNDVAFVVRGGGTKLHVGARPSRLDLIISTEKLNAIFEHDEGNATIEAGAGITLDALNAAVGQCGQFVPLDWEAGSGATLGGVVATNHFGSTKMRYTAPRDLVVGLRAGLSDGRVVKAGSKVVKNVSGYDLNKLFIGSYGTLGLITRVTIRLRPNDAASSEWSATYMLWSEAQAMAQQILTGPYVPALVSVETEGQALRLKARFDGSQAAVETQMARLPEAAPLPSVEKQPSVLKLRAHLPYSRASAWAQMAQAEGAYAVSWDCATGVVRAGFSVLPDEPVKTVATLRAAAESQDGFAVVTRAPEELKTSEFVWGKQRGDGGLQKKLKETFDPAHVCAPGRFAL